MKDHAHTGGLDLRATLKAILEARENYEPDSLTIQLLKELQTVVPTDGFEAQRGQGGVADTFPDHQEEAADTWERAQARAIWGHANAGSMDKKYGYGEHTQRRRRGPGRAGGVSSTGVQKGNGPDARDGRRSRPVDRSHRRYRDSGLPRPRLHCPTGGKRKRQRGRAVSADAGEGCIRGVETRWDRAAPGQQRCTMCTCARGSRALEERSRGSDSRSGRQSIGKEPVHRGES